MLTRLKYAGPAGGAGQADYSRPEHRCLLKVGQKRNLNQSMSDENMYLNSVQTSDAGSWEQDLGDGGVPQQMDGGHTAQG